MDDSLYTTSFTLYYLPLPTPQRLLNLLSAADGALQTHADKLQDDLRSTSRRPAYETEEEKQKLGLLRSCNIISLPDPQGIAITITYDRATYKLIILASQSPSPPQLPLLLMKASADFTKRIFAYLATTFHLPTTPTPVKLSSYLLLSTLQSYISSLRHTLSPVAETESILSLLRDILGKLKLTITVNIPSSTTQHSGTSISNSLRTIDIDIPPETLHQLLNLSIKSPPPPRPRSRKDIDNPPQLPPITFLANLRSYISDRTGLILPITPTSSTNAKKPPSTQPDPPLRITRIQSTAFAIGIEGRLKLGIKPVELMNAIPGLTSGDENVVRLANKDLLREVVREAEAAVAKGGG